MLARTFFQVFDVFVHIHCHKLGKNRTQMQTKVKAQVQWINQSLHDNFRGHKNRTGTQNPEQNTFHDKRSRTTVNRTAGKQEGTQQTETHWNTDNDTRMAKGGEDEQEQVKTTRLSQGRHRREKNKDKKTQTYIHTWHTFYDVVLGSNCWLPSSEEFIAIPDMLYIMFVASVLFQHNTKQTINNKI